jgi:hypothetical protein
MGPVPAAAPAADESSSDEEEVEVVGPDSWRKAPVMTEQQKVRLEVWGELHTRKRRRGEVY